MSVYRVIDKLEATVREGVWLPFGARIVSMDRLLDLVEKLRASLPDEVNRAKAVTKDKDRLLEDARYKAAAIVEEASSTKTQMLSDAEIVRLAQTRADELLSDAESRAREVRRGARRRDAPRASRRDASAPVRSGLSFRPLVSRPYPLHRRASLDGIDVCVGPAASCSESGRPFAR